MKISKIYCNLPNLFGPILFNLGSIGDSSINIVMASIKKPKDSKKDAHNLGKTTLIHIIDFLLLKGVSEESSFLIKHRDIFDKFVFYGEFLSVTGNYITVRRSVKQSSKASFKIHPTRNQNLDSLIDENWDHFEVAEKPAKKILDSYFSLTEINPWDYRKGVSYFLRSQQDYNDYFQISKFSKGSDSAWKPYLAKVLGFPYEIIEKKYAIDVSIDAAKVRLKDAESAATSSLEDIGKLRVKIANRQAEINSAQQRIDNFSFTDEETKLTAKLAGNLEKEISTINGTLYNLQLDLNRATESIQNAASINLEKIDTLYKEAGVYLPKELICDYEDLIEFVKNITTDRNKQLKKQVAYYKTEIETLTKNRNTLDLERQNKLSVIKDVDTLSKYKSLQKDLIEANTEVRILQNQIDKLESAKTIRETIKELENEQRRLTNQIENFPDAAPPIYMSIAEVFHSFVKITLDITGNFYIKANENGNIEYRIDTEEATINSNVKVTSQSKGTTYRKLLCALFDLAVLSVYSDKRFFHFAYHDGILEGLDNRKKIALLNLIREVCKSKGIQYILTLIESDIPRDENDKKIEFLSSEIILKLSDDGDKGRLFRMASF
jgi:uncharacterized protein YydD (DUF2326 family)